jgi:hypothetical protein
MRHLWPFKFSVKTRKTDDMEVCTDDISNMTCEHYRMTCGIHTTKMDESKDERVLYSRHGRMTLTSIRKVVSSESDTWTSDVTC